MVVLIDGSQDNGLAFHTADIYAIIILNGRLYLVRVVVLAAVRQLVVQIRLEENLEICGIVARSCLRLLCTVIVQVIQYLVRVPALLFHTGK